MTELKKEESINIQLTQPIEHMQVNKTIVGEMRKKMSWSDWFKGISYFFASLILKPRETLMLLDKSIV